MDMEPQDQDMEFDAGPRLLVCLAGDSLRSLFAGGF